MKKLLYAAFAFVFTSLSANAKDIDLEIIADGVSQQIFSQKGSGFSERFSPCSTFKIPLSLMGYDSGILIDADMPVMTYKTEYKAPLDSWRKDQTPASWIQNSCVWYSQRLTEKLGQDLIKTYLKLFNYGNQDFSGGLTNAWLCSSLKISPMEQLKFLMNYLNGKIQISETARIMTKQLLFLEEIGGGDWKFYGKTGSGYYMNEDGTYDQSAKSGWFIGWVEKGTKRYIIVVFIQNKEDTKEYAGPRAKEKAKKALLASGLLTF